MGRARAGSGTFPAAGVAGGGARFELLERVGVGGIAEIHRAHLFGLDGFSKIVALKVLRPELAGERAHRERFGIEARIGALLEHPNIAAVYDFVEVDGRPTIVMEHVAGLDLLQLLGRLTQRRRRLPPELAVYVAIEVARALAHAHRLPSAAAGVPGAGSIVHGDISPANVMLGERGHVKLVDFGVADISAATLGVRSFRGKPGYVSPEVVLGRPCDARSDLFSLAIVLWEMLTLKRLFKADDDAETLRNVVEVRVEGRFARHDYVPAPLLDLITRALARDPADRFQSADEMADALSRWLIEVGLRPGPSLLAAFLDEVCRPAPTPVGETAPEPPAPPAASLDLSGLEAVLAEIDSAPAVGGLERLVSGRWLSPFDEVSPASDAGVLAALDPWVLPAILMRLGASRATGALTASDGLREKVVHLEGGQVVHVASNVASELLGHRLTRAGLVSTEHAHRGLELSAQTGLKLGDALIRLRALDDARLSEALDEQLGARLSELMTWSAGTLDFQPGQRLAEASRLRARPMLPLIVRGLRQSLSPYRAASALEPFAPRRMHWCATSGEVIEALEPALPEVVSLLLTSDATARVGEVIARGPSPQAFALLIAAQLEYVRLL